ncbi:MAG: beta-lactamase family protein [Chitinophaga sp.]|uniref:serine hydrolase domain-containing protein n=1 Tax=Chitinophaga sp. TaxID=1869181 RepID=UPI001B23369C|nr:serine hydrolase domain-containing protein [Chitinophaga sp.]MBO9732571.1 beta-lactamase family protein [Chitinophaga sp.]
MKKKLLFGCLLSGAVLTFLSCARKSDAPLTTPGSYADVEKVLTDAVNNEFGGKCYAIIQVDGKTVISKGYGGFESTTVRPIASCSKWLSAAVLMSLVDDGKLQLSDTIGKYLPVFTTYRKGAITIAQLFSHTSGFPGESAQGYESDGFSTLEIAANNIAANVPLKYAPGSTFEYGGLSMQIAGRICEVASGKSWKVLADENLFTPLGMAHTGYGLGSNPKIAGGVSSSPDDYMLFLYMIMNKGVAANGKRVLSEAAIAAMEQPQTSNATTFAYSPYPQVLLTSKGLYGIGNWRDVTTPDDILIENCSPGLFGSHPWVNRSKKITGFIFTYIAVNGYTTTMPASRKIRLMVRSK